MAGQGTELTGKRIAVLGAGTEGTATARWLLGQGCRVTVLDRAPAGELANADALKTAGAELVTGQDYLKDLTDYEVIFRSPGIPFLTPEIQAAKQAGVVVTSHTKLFFERCPAPIVGITGTKGKGTTATLLAGMLKAAARPVHLGGNIGVPPLEFLDKVKPADLVILELSSFQLQDLEQSPHLAIVTNLGEDHLDHHRDAAEYHAAKENILKYQTAEDIAVLNADDPASGRLEKVGSGKRYHFGPTATPPGAYLEDDTVMVDLGDGALAVCAAEDIPVPGPHNRQNVMAAAVAARLLDVPAEPIEQAVLDYQPLPYHLEPVGEHRGVRYINDSYSTSPVSAIPAIGSFDTPLVLILGGATKGLDYAGLGEVIVRANVRGIVLLGPAGAEIRNAVAQAADTADRSVPPTRTALGPEEIVPLAAEMAKSGDTVLFSPAATSFDMFPNYRERGRFFTEQVRAL